MRARLSWAIVVVLMLLVLISAIVRRGGKSTEKKVATPNFKAPEIPEIKPTLADITNGAVSFFNSEGLPLVGYVANGTNEIRLFSSPNGATALGGELKPITRPIVDSYVRMLETRARAEEMKREGEVQKTREAELRASIEKAKVEEERKRIDASNAIVQAKIEAEKRRIEDSNAVVRAAVEVADYRGRYLALSSTFDRAVLIIDEQKNPNLALSSFIADSFREAGSKSTPGFFKPAFIQDGLFDKVFSGQTDAANRLQFTNILQSLLLGKQTVSYSTNPNLQDVVTANMTLELSTAFARDLQPMGGQTLRATAAGFSRDEARLSAEEKIISQLTNGVLQKLDKSLSQK